MYQPTNRVDGANLEFIELYNSSPWPEDLSGFRISGDFGWTFPPNTRLAAHSFLVVAPHVVPVSQVYGIPNVSGPMLTNAVLGDASGTVRLRNRAGAILLEVNYAQDLPWPKLADGRGHSLVLTRPSLGEGDPRAWTASALPGGSPGRAEPPVADPLRALVINEILPNSAALELDFVEIYNRSDQPLDISGCILSDNPTDAKFVFQATMLAPHAYLALDEVSLGFDLKNDGDTVYLRGPTGVILDAVAYGALPDNVSLGRVPAGGPDFMLHCPSTPAAPNSTFHAGEIVINEIMYAPISGESDDEFIELHNRGTNLMDVGGWQFTSGIHFTNPPGLKIGPGGYLVVARNVARLLANYPQLSLTQVVGNFSGSLSDTGERLILTSPSPVFDGINSNTVQVVVDEVPFGVWGRWSHGGGSSLERIDPRADGRFAANWADSDESAKAPWTTIEITGQLAFGNGIANELHALLLGEGECLLDNVEVRPAGGASLVPNGLFDSGTANWVLQGNHVRSSADLGGVGGSRCLHLRASGPGDTGVNRVETPLLGSVSVSGTATLRAQARWLAGREHLLLRLNGNWLEASTKLIVPRNLGTPGAPNSRTMTNAGPVLFDVQHAPILPASLLPVVVTAQVHDPDGVSALRLRYRVDPGTAFTEVPMLDDGLGGDAAADDGVFSAVVPGQSSGTCVAFHIEAVDGATPPATNRFPGGAPAKECLILFDDAPLTGALGDYRLWLTATNNAEWNGRSKLSEEPVDCTLVWNGARVFHNAGVRYVSTLPLRGNGYVVTLPEGQLLFGSRELRVERAMSGLDNPGLRDIAALWMEDQLGLPVFPPRAVKMRVIGDTNSSLMLERHLPDSSFLADWFDAGEEGELFEVSNWREFDNALEPSEVFSANPTLENFAPSGEGKRKARYRWTWRQRIAGAFEEEDLGLYGLVDAANAPDATLVNQLGAALDPGWIRALALRHAVADDYGYGATNAANDFAFRDGAGTWQLLPARFLFSLGASGGFGSATQNLFQAADPTVGRMLNRPPFRRRYLQNLKAAADGPLAATNCLPFLQSVSAVLASEGFSTAPLTTLTNWIETRRTNILAQMPTVAFLPPSLVVSGNVAILSGLAPISVDSFTIETSVAIGMPTVAAAVQPTWLSVSNWSISFSLDKPTGWLVLTALNSARAPLTNWGFVINFSGAPNPVGAIVISEIMARPAIPGAGYVELYNKSSNAFDLSTWRLPELEFRFPVGSFLPPGGFLVVAENQAAFLAAYGAAIPIAGICEGALQEAGGTVTLRKPDGTIVDKVHYETAAPWPASLPGESLQLIDFAQDNGRVANWFAGAPPSGWKFFSYTSILPTNSINFILLLFSAGDLYVDDLWLVPGTVPEMGTNVLQNGDFEGPSLDPWIPQGNHSNSVLSADFVHSGAASLHLIASSFGTIASNVRQSIPAMTSTQVFTLSFWYLGGSSNNQLTARTSPGSSLIAILPVPARGTSQVTATPGASNNVASALPPFPPLWLNEIGPLNVSGPTDNFGEHEPWIELYNSGTNSVSLDGLYLSDIVTVPDQWAFPSNGVLGPGQFAIVWADGDTNQSAPASLHTNFRLDPGGGFVGLAQRVNGRLRVLDYLNYPAVPADRSYGAFPNGQPVDRTLLNPSTPGASNIPPVNIFINEWMSASTVRDPADGNLDDWFELYNAGASPFDPAGCYLTGDPLTPTAFTIPPGHVIPPHGFLMVWADNTPQENTTLSPDLHVDFRLSRHGDYIGLFAQDGLTRIDSVNSLEPPTSQSEGRFPDGNSVKFFLRLPTPGAANALELPNTVPVVAPIPDRTIRLGDTLSFQAMASDPDFPRQALSFSLGGSPPDGASLSNGGFFSWTPSVDQAPSTNLITIRVTDSGTPPLSTSTTFAIAVWLRPVANLRVYDNGHIAIRFDSIPNRNYVVEWKLRLEDNPWQGLTPPIPAAGTTLTVNDQIDSGSGSQRFYRILEMP